MRDIAHIHIRHPQPLENCCAKCAQLYDGVMEPTTTAIRDYFAKLGFSAEIADIYLALHSHGPQTLSQLARSSGVERTRIYRLMDELITSNLVETEAEYKRGVIKAAPIANLHILINDKEREVAALKEELGLIEQVLGRNQLSSPTTRVQVYRGPEGIRQMIWNILRSTTPIYGYHFHILDEYIGRPFMSRWSDEFAERRLHCNLLVSDDYVQSWKSYVSERGGSRIRGIQYNYLSPDLFPITHSSNVYNDVTAYFNWQGGDVFGIELYNQQVADAQRVLMRGLWEQSAPETRI